MTDLQWTGHVMVVDPFERHGRQYVVAIDDRTQCQGTERLSQCEREVLMLALAGYHDKAIAYERSLALSTVRALIARAATRLHAGSRKELFHKVRASLDSERIGGREKPASSNLRSAPQRLPPENGGTRAEGTNRKRRAATAHECLLAVVNFDRKTSPFPVWTDPS